MSLRVCSQPSLAMTGRVGSSAGQVVERRGVVALGRGVARSSATPQLSLSGTHVTTHGWLRSRRTTSVHSRTTRCTAVGLNAALGISAQTSSPEPVAPGRGSAGPRSSGGCGPVEPNDFTVSTSARSASSSGAARCDCGQYPCSRTEPQVVGATVEDEPAVPDAPHRGTRRTTWPRRDRPVRGDERDPGVEEVGPLRRPQQVAEVLAVPCLGELEDADRRGGADADDGLGDDRSGRVRRTSSRVPSTGVPLSSASRVTRPRTRSGVQSSRVRCRSPTASSQTGCQMPVVRWYQMSCGSGRQSCLPRGWAGSSTGSSARTTTTWSPVGSSASVMSAWNGCGRPRAGRPASR